MITMAAVRLRDGRVFVGKTHGECFLTIKASVCDGTIQGLKDACVGHVQGFINDRLEFKTRLEAWDEANAEGQVSGVRRDLSSEDVLF